MHWYFESRIDLIISTIHVMFLFFLGLLFFLLGRQSSNKSLMSNDSSIQTGEYSPRTQPTRSIAVFFVLVAVYFSLQLGLHR